LLGQVVPLEKEQDLPKISLPGANTLTKAGGGAVTQGDGGAPRQVIVGIAGRDVERGGFRPGGAGVSCVGTRLAPLPTYGLKE
ncbi:hypothetical protein, partial [Methylicorpusculum sp.]|uniref:hypothetical protein n=1 Tax=Methylicorpusculum sp. TaxID=2713644 RepID=UPI002AB9D10C